MGEILFRGKRVYDGMWVEGYYAKYRNIMDKVYTAILQFDAEDGGDVYCDGIIPVIPETVGQYTGFKDKNGKKIFEGDIICLTSSFGDRLIATIQWEKQDGAFRISLKSASGLFSNFRSFEIEVIGNETDNPELLQEDAQ